MAAEVHAAGAGMIIIRADSTHDRRSRAAEINAARRAFERDTGTRLALVTKSYSETYGFLSRSEFRYRAVS